jgi:3-methyladenine DNA glycosylase AlkD
MSIIDEIRTELFKMQDLKYRDFSSKQIPTADKESFIGIRTPELRKYAKQVGKREDIDEFLNDLPHKYFDENQLHAFILSEMKDMEKCSEEVDKFLPFVDNWATCDQLSPKIFKKNRKALLPQIKKWIKSKETYTVRFGIGMLMEHFLDEDFDPKYPEMVSKVKSEEYYINMMIAWYFATALAKQYDAILPYIQEERLEKWTHNKTVQKAVESNRITAEQKEYLRKYKKSV